VEHGIDSRMGHVSGNASARWQMSESPWFLESQPRKGTPPEASSQDYSAAMREKPHHSTPGWQMHMDTPIHNFSLIAPACAVPKCTLSAVRGFPNREARLPSGGEYFAGLRTTSRRCTDGHARFVCADHRPEVR
jgi:hypothetical protein